MSMEQDEIISGNIRNENEIIEIMDDSRVHLLPFEQNLMLDTFIDDVLFITSKGLLIERIFLNHLLLWNMPDSTAFVINTTVDDEHYFAENLRKIDLKFPPKIISADVTAKERTLIYKTGGVQFITSRILMMDLLTNRIPFDKVSGIFVYRAHEIIARYQESFVLRLFREKKPNGFIKAFSDNPSSITSSGIGQLQRLLGKLYIKRVKILPRFDSDVKDEFDKNQPKISHFSIELPQSNKKIRIGIQEIIKTCLRELKQSMPQIASVSLTEDDELIFMTGGHKTNFEADLEKKSLLLNERQRRILNDLKILRVLLSKVEDLHPADALLYTRKIRNDKDILENNGGWLFTSLAASIFTSIEEECKEKDSSGNHLSARPPKWDIFRSILEEVSGKLISDNSDSPVLVLVSSYRLSRQLIDMVKFGSNRFAHILNNDITDIHRRESLSAAPLCAPHWNPVMVVHYDVELFEKERVDLKTRLKDTQKQIRKDIKRRTNKLSIEAMNDPKQTNLDQFGILRYAKKRKNLERRSDRKKINIESADNDIRVNKETLLRNNETVPRGKLPEDPFTLYYHQEENEISALKAQTERVYETVLLEEGEMGVWSASDRISEINHENKEADEAAEGAGTKHESTYNRSLDSLLVFIELGNRYHLLNALENLRPNYIITYNSDIISLRIIESFKVCNKDNKLELYNLLYTGTSEEERYLNSIRTEQCSLQELIKEQGVLMIPKEYDVGRENGRKLAFSKTDSRLKKRIGSQGSDDCENRPNIIVDMREFNSELPTVLYRLGIDLHPTTLEVGDYILSPTICVERKAIDDLAQSLNNGRVFKQIEQMLRHYERTILLVESSEKFRQKIVNGGPFQGELTKRSRETRSLLAILIRMNPRLLLLWSCSPSHSADLFEEIKLDQPGPDLKTAVGIRSDDLGTAIDSISIPSKNGRLNVVLKRQLSSLPGFTSQDIEALMRNASNETVGAGNDGDSAQIFGNLHELTQAPIERLEYVLKNRTQAEYLYDLFHTDFRMIHI